MVKHNMFDHFVGLSLKGLNTGSVSLAREGKRQMT